MSSISVVMVTCNDGELLDLSIRSVIDWADEVIVGDMSSSDGSSDVARSLGATVIDVPRSPTSEYVRQALIDRASGEWLLLLDPDEVVEPNLAERLAIVVRDGDGDAVEVTCRTYSMGTLLRGSGWSPVQERHVRLFRRGAVDLRAAVHAPTRPLPGRKLASVPTSEGAIVHFNYVGWDQFLDKLNRYTRLEAEERVAAGEPASLLRLARELLDELLYRGIRGRVWQDGLLGVLLLAHMLWYRLSVFAKHWQLAREATPENVAAAYRKIAGQILEEAHIDGATS